MPDETPAPAPGPALMRTDPFEFNARLKTVLDNTEQLRKLDISDIQKLALIARAAAGACGAGCGGC
jgi:hypothetical protein